MFKSHLSWRHDSSLVLILCAAACIGLFYFASGLWLGQEAMIVFGLCTLLMALFCFPKGYWAMLASLVFAISAGLAGPDMVEPVVVTYGRNSVLAVFALMMAVNAFLRRKRNKRPVSLSDF